MEQKKTTQKKTEKDILVAANLLVQLVEKSGAEISLSELSKIRRATNKAILAIVEARRPSKKERLQARIAKAQADLAALDK